METIAETKIDLSRYHNALSRKHQLVRLLWSVVWGLFARPLPRSMGSSWKRLLLRLFGARIHPTAVVYSSAKVYYPANLVMERYACLASDVDCYNVAPIRIGANATVSQRAYLCTASHDITNPLNPLITAPIVIEDQAWVAAGAFVGMGVTVGQGAVVGARAAVFKEVEPWTVVGGNPAKEIKKRILK
ncbi:putative colanic acid biosynthesis acetyltransferase [Bacteroides sp. AN502(2024)]|uniref:putative colanic acid biosynthesis acetyltransferase n=1 Tax=Bacteroides sp. AN502(2024) TaxID=3160599 RepID=UPI0035188547